MLVRALSTVSLALFAFLAPPPNLRAFRADLCGVPFAAPVGPKLIYTPMYPVFDAPTRASMRAAYKARGYTHWPISIDAGYRDGGRDVYPRFRYSDRPEDYRIFLQELWNDGLIPVVFLMDDEGPHTAEHLARFLATNRDLIKVAAIGWELNDWLSDEATIQAAKDLRRMLGPDVLLYAHFTAGRVASCRAKGCDVAWWRSMRGVLSGLLYQHDPKATMSDFQSSLKIWVSRFRDGHDGWPTGFDLVAFEYLAFEKFRGRATEAEGIARGTAAMQVDGVIGFGDGGPGG